jgi:L-malate glycosyltransferase
MQQKSKTKILILENSFGITGAFKSIFGLTQSIDHEYEFHFAIRKNTPLSFLLNKQNVPFIELPYLEIGRNWRIIFYFPILFLNTWRVINYTSQHQIRILHVNDLYNMVGVLVKIIRPKAKIIYHVRLMPDSYVGKFYPYWLKLINTWADYVIAVSDAVNQSIKMIVSKPIQIIYDFVPLEEKWQKDKEKNKTIKFVYPANYSKGKGQDFALKAFAEVYRTHQNILLSFYGSDAGAEKNSEFKRGLIQESIVLRISEAVSFENATDNIEKVMKDADVVLMFSESESFSLVCYEALFYGTPVIASDCGGPRELIENNICGMLVVNRDIPSMANAMTALISSNEFRLALSANGQKAIRDKMNSHQASAKLSSAYKHCIA